MESRSGCNRDYDPVNLIHLDVRIVNPKIASLADKMLQHPDHWAFAQIVGVLLERQADLITPNFTGPKSSVA